MRTLITGVTGMIGRELRSRIPESIGSSRNPTPDRFGPSAARTIRWDPEAGVAPLAELGELEAVIHLAGEPVAAGRWTTEPKRRMRDSRVIGTRNLVAGIEEMAHRPRVLISASAVGYYGDRDDEVLTEGSRAGTGFLADVCAAWENEALAAEKLGVRVVCLRIGIALAQNDGALPRMLPPYRMGVGGRLGSGKQWMPWIHLDDVVGLTLHAVENEAVRGPMNAVAPNPAISTDFTRVLGRVLHRPTLFPVPIVALRVGFGEMSEVLLASQRVMPTVAQKSGYEFHYSDLESALEATLGSGERSTTSALVR